MSNSSSSPTSPTWANAAADWFAGLFSATPPQRTLESQDDRLFTSLNTFQVVDLLQERRSEIEKAIPQADVLAKHPGLLALLLNVFRSNNEQTTPSQIKVLKEAARSFWENYRLEIQPSVDTISIVLNLARVDAANNQACLQFLLQHPDASLQAIQHFYGTNDPRELYSRIRRRWDRLKSDISSLRDLGTLNPLLLHLPPPIHTGASLDFVARFVDALGRPTLANTLPTLNEDLARELRLFQWDVFTRTPGGDEFRPAKRTKGVTGLPSEEFLRFLVMANRNAHAHYYIGLAGRPYPRTQAASQQTRDIDFESFRNLLNEATTVHRPLHKDLIESLSASLVASNAKERMSDQLILVRDGELTFFSLLWTLRHLGVVTLKDAGWLEDGPESPVSADAKFAYRNTQASWSRTGFLEYFDWLGLIIPDGDSIIFTRRWRALARWLRRGPSDIADRCFKRLVLTSDEVATKETIRDAYSRASIYLRSKDFLFAYELAKQDAILLLKGLLQSLVPALDPVNRTAWDRDLLRLCRVPFLPLELTLRAYQPCEMNLLLALLGSHPVASGAKPVLAPVAIGFATIIGEIPEHSDQATGAENYAAWAGPYWSFLSAMANEVSARFLADHFHQVGPLQRLQEELRNLVGSSKLNTHDQIEEATLSGFLNHPEKYPSLDRIFRFFGTDKENLTEFFYNGSQLPDGTKEAFKVLANPKRTVESHLLLLLAEACHKELCQRGTGALTSLGTTKAFKVWEPARAGHDDQEMLKLFWEMCTALFKPASGKRRPIEKSSESNLLNVVLTDDELSFELDIDFTLLSERIDERTARMLAGVAPTGEERTSSFPLWGFWLASAIRNNTRKPPTPRGWRNNIAWFDVEIGEGGTTVLKWKKAT